MVTESKADSRLRPDSIPGACRAGTEASHCFTLYALFPAIVPRMNRAWGQVGTTKSCAQQAEQPQSHSLLQREAGRLGGRLRLGRGRGSAGPSSRECGA